MKVICLIQYIRDYCGGSYKLFLERARRMRIERSQDAYADYTYYHDDENGVIVEDRFSIGD